MPLTSQCSTSPLITCHSPHSGALHHSLHATHLTVEHFTSHYMPLTSQWSTSPLTTCHSPHSGAYHLSLHATHPTVEHFTSHYMPLTSQWSTSPLITCHSPHSGALHLSLHVPHLTVEHFTTHITSLKSQPLLLNKYCRSHWLRSQTYLEPSNHTCMATNCQQMRGVGLASKQWSLHFFK